MSLLVWQNDCEIESRAWIEQKQWFRWKTSTDPSRWIQITIHTAAVKICSHLNIMQGVFALNPICTQGKLSSFLFSVCMRVCVFFLSFRTVSINARVCIIMWILCIHKFSRSFDSLFDSVYPLVWTHCSKSIELSRALLFKMQKLDWKR